jgi:Mg2+ and Co2+ transporter CorA
VVRTPRLVNGHIEFGESHIFFGARYLLTVRHGASMPFAPARERCEKNPELMQLGPSYALYSVLDAVVDNYFPIVEEFQQGTRTSWKRTSSPRPTRRKPSTACTSSRATSRRCGWR